MAIQKQLDLSAAAALPSDLPAVPHLARPKNAPRALFEKSIVTRAMKDAFVKLDPRVVAKNPVMFVVEIGSAITSYFWLRGLVTHAADTLFVGQVSLWLWFTVVFANFAE